MASNKGQQARHYLHSVLAREQVRTVLTAQDIETVEVNQRIDSLTDAEAIRLAKTIEHLPAGGSTASVNGLPLGFCFFQNLFDLFLKTIHLRFR